MARLGSFHSALGGKVTRPPAQGGSAGAVDTALAAPGCGYAAYLRHFVIYTYTRAPILRLVRQAQSPTGRRRPQALHTEHWA
jgi:hypothetical protein